MGVTDLSQINEGTSFADAFAELGTTFGAAFGPKGLGSLFSDASRIPLVLMTIFAFSLADTFDTIGTFIGTGRKSGILMMKKLYVKVQDLNQRWIKLYLQTQLVHLLEL